MNSDIKNDSADCNRDPLSGAPGAHPIGTGVGATGGAIAGATIGSIAGPVGTLVGGAVGAVVGGLAGKAVGEGVNPTLEAEHWNKAYSREPYYDDKFGPDDYAPAYKLGYEHRDRYPGQTFDQAHNTLESEWDRVKGNSRLAWDQAKPATRAAWHRVERAIPGDADGDGI